MIIFSALRDIQEHQKAYFGHLRQTFGQGIGQCLELISAHIIIIA